MLLIISKLVKIRTVLFSILFSLRDVVEVDRLREVVTVFPKVEEKICGLN